MVDDLSDVWAELKALRAEVRQDRASTPFENASITSGRLRLAGGELRVDEDGLFTLIGTFNQSGDYNVLSGGMVTVQGGGGIAVQDGGAVTVQDGGAVAVQGGGELRISGNAALYSGGRFDVRAGGTLGVAGDVNVQSGGAMQVASGGEIVVNGPVPVRLKQGSVGGVAQAMIQFENTGTSIFANQAGGKVNLVIQSGSGRIQINDDGVAFPGLRTENAASYLGVDANGYLVKAAAGSGGGPGGGGDPDPGEDLGNFQWPFSLSTVTSEYGPRTTPYTGFHEGIDFGNPPATAGAPIIAAGDGTVAVNTFSAGWGNYVRITHTVNGQQLSTLYAHMNAPGLPPVGSSVSKGDVIGYVGNTGNSYGAHLHLECWMGTSYGTHVNPRAFMAAYGPE